MVQQTAGVAHILQLLAGIKGGEYLLENVQALANARVDGHVNALWRGGTLGIHMGCCACTEVPTANAAIMKNCFIIFIIILDAKLLH